MRGLLVLPPRSNSVTAWHGYDQSRLARDRAFTSAHLGAPPVRACVRELLDSRAAFVPFHPAVAYRFAVLLRLHVHFASGLRIFIARGRLSLSRWRGESHRERIHRRSTCEEMAGLCVVTGKRKLTVTTLDKPHDVWA